MLSQPEVSIIIINFNTFDLTCKCIDSIYKKTKNISFEVILVDNASTEYDANLFLKAFPNIKLIKNKINVGFAKGNNIGIAESSGKYILLLNSDTELNNNAVYLSYKKLQSDKKIGALSARLLSPDNSIQHPAGRFPSVYLELREFFRVNNFTNKVKLAKLYLYDRFDHQSETECDWIWGTFFMFPRKILRLFQENKLNEDFFMYGEDMQWCWHINKTGHKILYFPEAEVLHHGGASTKDIEAGEEKYFTYMFPNFYKVCEQFRGKITTKIIFTIKALFLISAGSTKGRRILNHIQSLK